MTSLIRAYTPEDLEACAVLYAAVFNAEPWLDEWDIPTAAAYLADVTQTPGFIGYVATTTTTTATTPCSDCRDSRIDGIILGNRRHWWRGDIAFIQEMCVASQLQGQGIGSQLLEAFRLDAQSQGIRNISLLTERHYAAASFYRRHGFKEAKNTRLLYRFISRPERRDDHDR
ncbi:GNAT family N-acetyltransferase [Paenibacillus sp. YYML68]|uniref:GNAT family N-acetyltransferase n=1 Tax=Paenibacillus sp. YYML68 TaxID=2909250 RepID=UPI0024901F79|nr:GNAT family N-acetyltransferase [Paenibacillus sp. YYML68]